MTRRELLRRGVVGSAVAMGTVVGSTTGAEEKKRKVRVGMVGTGHSHAAGKMEALRRLREEYEVVGVCEGDEGRRKSLAGRKESEGVPVMGEEQLLREAGVEVVLVETGVAEQEATARRVAEAGVHMHLEKPGGASLPGFRKLLERMAEKKRVLQMGYMFRGNPAFQFCYRAVREGWLGEVYEVHGVIGKVAGERERAEAGEFAGGMMFELGCHLVDAMVTVLGRPSGVKAFVRRAEGGDGLAENTLAVFEYPKALATIRSSALDVEGGSRRQFVVCGTKGTVTIHPLERPRVVMTLDREVGGYRRGTQEVEMPGMSGRYDGQLVELARIVRGEREVDYGAEHDLAVMEAVLRGSGMGVE